MSVTSIRLSLDIEQPLFDLTQKLDRSRNYLINQAVAEFLARQAMAQDRWQETLEALDSVKNGELVDSESVDKWMGSWGSDNELPKPTV